MARESFAEQVIATIAGAARMAAVGGGDVVRLTSTPDDWIDAGIRTTSGPTLPALRAMSQHLLPRARCAGSTTSRPRGPVLLVGNHSGGTLIADTFVFAQAFYDHFGPLRRFHQLVHDLVFKLPGVRASLTRYGGVPASPENMARALERDAALLVYPGGDHETYRPSWESAKIDFAGRTGFARLAIEHGVPIVPVVAIGGQETALFLGQGRGIAKLLRLDSLCAAQGVPGPGRAAVRGHGARPAGPHPAAVEDRGAGASAGRAEGARTRTTPTSASPAPCSAR